MDLDVRDGMESKYPSIVCVKRHTSSRFNQMFGIKRLEGGLRGTGIDAKYCLHVCPPLN